MTPGTWSELWVDPVRLSEELGPSTTSRPHRLFLETCAFYDRIPGLYCSGSARTRVPIPLALTTAKPRGGVQERFLAPWSVEARPTPRTVTFHGADLVEPPALPAIALRDPANQAMPAAKVTQAVATAVATSRYAQLPVRKGVSAWTARLEAGTTYELELAAGSRTKPYSPYVDMVILTTDTARTPTATELCAP